MHGCLPYQVQRHCRNYWQRPLRDEHCSLGACPHSSCICVVTARHALYAACHSTCTVHAVSSGCDLSTERPVISVHIFFVHDGSGHCLSTRKSIQQVLALQHLMENPEAKCDWKRVSTAFPRTTHCNDIPALDCRPHSTMLNDRQLC